MPKLNKANAKKALTLNREVGNRLKHNETVRINKMLAAQRLEFLALQKMGINTAR
jgi:hypothetical protein